MNDRDSGPVSSMCRPVSGCPADRTESGWCSAPIKARRWSSSGVGQSEIRSGDGVVRFSRRVCPAHYQTHVVQGRIQRRPRNPRIPRSLCRNPRARATAATPNAHSRFVTNLRQSRGLLIHGARRPDLAQTGSLRSSGNRRSPAARVGHLGPDVSSWPVVSASRRSEGAPAILGPRDCISTSTYIKSAAASISRKSPEQAIG